MLPFTPEQFLAVFVNYNTATWPSQIAAYFAHHPPVPNWLLVVPAIWSLIGGSAAIVLNVPQDWLLLFSGGIAVPLIVVRDRRVKQDLRTG
jgi:hypothetical protein